MREFDIRQGWKAWQFNNCAEWLNLECGIVVGTARACLAGESANGASPADHYQVVVHVDEAALRRAATGSAAFRAARTRAGWKRIT